MNDKKCCATVYPKERYGSFHGYSCTRKASVERDGKFYCKTHDPEERKKREEKSLEQYKEKQKVRRAYEYVMTRSLLKSEIQELQITLLDILDGNSAWYEIQYFTGLSDERCKEIESLYGKVLSEVRDDWLKFHRERREDDKRETNTL